MGGTIVFRWWTDFAGPSHSISCAGAGCHGTAAQAVHDKVGAGQMQQLKSIVPGSQEDTMMVMVMVILMVIVYPLSNQIYYI